MLIASSLLIGCAASETSESSSKSASDTADSSSAADNSPLIYQQISMSEAADYMANESGYILLDVRTVEEFNDKHIPGAINIPNETIGSDEIPKLPDKEQTILVYCRSGNRSKQAAQKLVEQGYSNIIEIGGINDWNGETVRE